MFRDIERPPRRARRVLPAPRRVARLSAATRSAGCAASITAGSSTSKATCVDMSSEPPGSAMLQGDEAEGLSRARRRAASSGSGWAPRSACASSSRPPGRRSPDIAYAIVKMHAACNWAQVLEGSIDSAHSSSLHSTEMPAGAGGQRQGDRRRTGRGRRTTRRRSCSSSRRATAFATPRSASRSCNPETQPVHPHHAVHRAVHRADSAERPVQPRADAGADRRREHHVLLDRLASGSGEGHLAGGLAPLLRRRRRASTWTRTGAKSAPCRTAICRTARR